MIGAACGAVELASGRQSNGVERRIRKLRSVGSSSVHRMAFYATYFALSLVIRNNGFSAGKKKFPFQ